MKKLCIFIATATTPALGLAQTLESQTLARAETVMVIGKKVALDDTELAGSVDVISQEEIAYEHVNDTFELLSKIPGAYVARFNQGIINTDVAIRGFASDGSTPHAKLLIDGIPSNLHNGYGELDQLFPLGIGSITVFKGTSDPRYGLFNIAGNYSINSRSDSEKQLEATLGSYDAKEAQVYWGEKNGKLTHNYFAGYRESEGYRERTNLEKYAVSGRWQWQHNDDTGFTAIARSSAYEGDSAGYLNQQQAASGPTQSASFAQQDGGNKNAQHLSLHLGHKFSEGLTLAAKAYGQDFERERWVRFSEGGNLQHRSDDQKQLGLVSTLSWQIAPQWALDWGVDAEQQEVIEQRFGTVSDDSSQRNLNNPLLDYRYEFNHYGTYLQLLHTPSDLLQWNAAIRADRLQGDFTDLADGSSARDMHDFGTIVQPKLNITLTPIDELALFANYGRSFQHPYSGAAYGDRDVSINDGAEVGLSLDVLSDLNMRLSYWGQHAKDEYVLVDGIQQNVGETERYGFDVAVNWSITEQLYLWGNYATVNSKIITPNDADASNRGNSLRSIPSFTAAAGLNYNISNAWTARLHMDAQGDYYVNEANTGGTFGDYTLLHLSAEYQQAQCYVKLQVNNLLDEYYEYVFDFSADGSNTIHSPGNGTHASMTLGFYL